VAGLAAGLGVLLVTVDVAEPAPTDVGAPSSTAPSGREFPSGSTVGPIASVTPTTATTTTLDLAITTTTLGLTTSTTTQPADRENITFDLQCIGLGLDSGSLIAASADASELLGLVQFLVVERIVAVIQLPEDDRSDLEALLTVLDLRRCAEMLQDLEGEFGEFAGSVGSREEAWLCAFAGEIVESDALTQWLRERERCLEPHDAVTVTTSSDDGGVLFEVESPATSDVGPFTIVEREP